VAGLYLHIPFCKQACHYCDFHFSTSLDNKELLVKALCRELELQKKYLEDELIETVYFGGGTPSLLTEGDLGRIFDSIHKNFSVNTGAEITLEANPDDLSQQNLSALNAIGVNRLSIGIQSFDDKVLRFLNRTHASTQATDCMANARAAGFNNISIDLIYAIPGQNQNVWEKNIEYAISISPEHISAYTLTIEEKTVFGSWLKSGKLEIETEDTAATQMEVLTTKLANAGYEHYEISNFSKPGFHSRHNSSYWRQQKYLGIGPSAHSYDKESRQHNIKNNSLYIKAIEQGQIPFEKEMLSRANQINEYLLTTLRTKWGSDLNYLIEKFDFDLVKMKKREFDGFLKLRLIERKGDTLVLTPKGKLLADKIAADFFVE
jgi:oxygen-independent coproporphyrinogen-3 oxidase